MPTFWPVSSSTSGSRARTWPGLSFGGALALEFHRRHLTLARSLILVSAYAGWAGSLPADAAEQRLQQALVLADLSPEDLLDALLPTMLSDGAPRDAVNEFEAAISGSTLVVLPGAGHVCNLEQPEDFNRVVRRFLQTVAPETSSSRVSSRPGLGIGRWWPREVVCLRASRGGGAGQACGSSDWGWSLRVWRRLERCGVSVGVEARWFGHSPSARLVGFREDGRPGGRSRPDAIVEAAHEGAGRAPLAEAYPGGARVALRR